MALNEFMLGASIKRVFIAFLVSFFVSPVLVWLGIEYKNLAKDLDAMGGQINMYTSNLSRASAMFKKVARLTFALFAFGITSIIIYYSYDYSIYNEILMSSFSASTTYSYLTFEISIYVMIFIEAIVSLILTLVNYSTLNSAWNLVLSHFTTNCSGEFWMPQASKQIERILKGLKKSTIAARLAIVILFVLAAFFGILFISEEDAYSASVYYTSYSILPYTYAMIVLAIVMVCLGIPALVLVLQGVANQAIGLFDLSRALQGNGAQAGIQPVFSGYRIDQQSPSRGMIPQAREVPMRVMENRFCPDCGFKLESEWKAQFCPKCGRKLI